MPLLVPPVVVVEPDTPPRVITTDTDTRIPRYSWITPDGREIPLDAPSLGWFTPRGRAGLGAAPVELVSDPHPRGGVRVRHIQPQARPITWPLFMSANSHLELVAMYRMLASAFTSTRRLGPGTLRVMRPDGTAREIRAYYDGGFTGEPGWGFLHEQVVLSLFCEDPYWRSTQPVSLPYQQATGASYLNPYMTVSPSSVLGATTATNAGDVEAWPVWSITGPATAITATNNTTGRAFTLTATLTAGQTATITTETAQVRGPAGENWTGNLNWPGAVMWGLQPGSNDVTFAVTGATSATRVVLSYVPRYETA
ncbi:phage distal tail protein [Micromonospora maritima]|uniref:phage distal tail protein n=1 Tax=Micromonospora maritima TaxID=986711 RepID=UPI00157DF7F1|nr:phage tail domain-containing protein [Micromonospora maritima]